ncbi:MAG: NAD-dependent epimerase/dehydratase family protein [Acidobacteria bacterium]|nr:MAG: NAD-dependent epimerase/dehydratase family protein [Acidobacteriota bacterium]
MMNVLILGANGQIARFATDLFLKSTDAQLTLYLRNSRRLKNSDPSRVRIVEGDVLDAQKLKESMAGQDVVYANLAGNLEEMARTIVKAMDETGVRRLLFVSSMGVYDEIPGDSLGSILDPYRKATRIIEDSDLDYTVLRPAWLNNRDEIAYGTTQKGEPFKNASAVVSRKSVADLVVKLATTPSMEIRRSVGIHKE